MSDQDGQADCQQKNKQADEARRRASFQKLRRSRQQRREESVAAQHAGLMLSDLVELASFRRDRHAVAFEINVNALRAVSRAFAARFAPVAKCASALDA